MVISFPLILNIDTLTSVLSVKLNANWNLLLKLGFGKRVTSLLTLTAGETQFVVYVNDERVGGGTLESFVLPALSQSLVYGTFQNDSKFQAESDGVVKISGVITYDVLFTFIGHQQKF